MTKFYRLGCRYFATTVPVPLSQTATARSRSFFTGFCRLRLHNTVLQKLQKIVYKNQWCKVNKPNNRIVSVLRSRCEGPAPAPPYIKQKKFLLLDLQPTEALGFKMLGILQYSKGICRPSDHTVGRRQDEIRTRDGRSRRNSEWYSLRLFQNWLNAY